MVCVCVQTCIQQHANVERSKVSPATLFWGEASFFLLPYDAGRLGGLQVSRQLSPIPVNPIKVLGWQVCTTRSRLLCEFQESCMPVLLPTEHFTRLEMRVRGPQTHISVLTLVGSGGKRQKYWIITLICKPQANVRSYLKDQHGWHLRNDTYGAPPAYRGRGIGTGKISWKHVKLKQK